MTKYFKEFISFLKTVIRHRYVILQLTKRDFQTMYLASYIGLPWAFIQPAVTILVIWFAVSVGLRAGPTESGIPYGPFLLMGLVPWFFISSAIIGATNSLMEFSYLIKKVNFRPSIIPIIKLLTALVIHLFFILILFIFAAAYGFRPSLYWLQLPYYLFATLVLVLGISWLTSSIMVFVRDVGQIVGVLIQLLFWATPLIWHHSLLEGNWRYMAYLNPFFYITNGYRETLFNQAWFFQYPGLTLYFWGVTGFFFVCGAMVFARLSPHYADVL